MNRTILLVAAMLLVAGTAVALTVDFDIILSTDWFLVFIGYLIDEDLENATVGEVRYISQNLSHQEICNSTSKFWDTDRSDGVIQLEVTSLVEQGCDFFAQLGGVTTDINAANSLYQFPIESTGDFFCIGYEVIGTGRCVMNTGDLNIVG